MIYLKLFLSFLKIGVVSFGGGYGMIALVREEVLGNGWLTEEMFLNYIAIAESTPGPIAINMATFVGSTQGGFLGALIATVGVCLPAFVIILLIAIFIRGFLQYKGVTACLDGIKPVVSALIVATAFTLIIGVIIGISNVNDEVSFDWRALTIFSVLGIIYLIVNKVKKKKLSPILLIIMAAALGMLFYGVMG